MNKSKIISNILLLCIIIIIIFQITCFILKKVAHKELFKNKNGSGKRDILMKIYKSDELYDPDEHTDSEVIDPDSTNGRDPDS